MYRLITIDVRLSFNSRQPFQLLTLMLTRSGMAKSTSGIPSVQPLLTCNLVA